MQLKTDPTYPRSLEGREKHRPHHLRRGREVLAENHGEILFTEYGVSGPAIFEISRYAIGEDVTLSLDLWPEQSEADTAAWLRRRQALALRNRELTCGQAFTGALHSRLSQMAAKYAGLSPSLPLADAPEEALAALAHTCKHFVLPVTGTCGFDQQVTAGGLRTDEFDPRTLQSRLVPGLWPPAARCWMWTAIAAATICNGHGPAAIWPGSFDKNSRILRILRNILLFLWYFSGFLLGFHRIYRQLIAAGRHSQQHLLRAVISLLPQLSLQPHAVSSRLPQILRQHPAVLHHRGLEQLLLGLHGQIRRCHRPLHGRRQERHRAVVL